MTAITIRLPNSVHQKIKAPAARDDVSVNQFIASAASEKMASVWSSTFSRRKPPRANAVTLITIRAWCGCTCTRGR
ncbi:toxin-antitoxin system HicB family antitoxin [Rhodoferax sp.]|uniref:toxin-antitoxin system HicB family antitoxin n=1 Tax=Rhodoferax sp. TaxID=50421 RepID=UPI003BAF11C9